MMSYGTRQNILFRPSLIWLVLLDNVSLENKCNRSNNLQFSSKIGLITLLIYPQMHSWTSAVKGKLKEHWVHRSDERLSYMTENNCGCNNKWTILCFDGNLPMAAYSGVLKRMRQQAGHHHFKMRFTHQLEPLVQILETNHVKPMKLRH